MTQPAKAQEPSMDEILASIRRMIGHDESAKTAPDAEPATPSAEAAAAPAPAAKVTTTQPFSQPQPARAGAAGAPVLSRANGREDTGAPFGKRDVAPGTEPLAPPLRTTAEEVGPGFDKRSGADAPVAGTAVAAAEGSVAARSPSDRPTERPSPRSSEPPDQPQLLSSGTTEAVDAAFGALAQAVAAQRPRTLEDLAGDLLRPMLKTWLDDNLPQMVERLVRAEIERVSRGR